MRYYDGEMFTSVEDAIKLYKQTKNIFDNKISDLEKNQQKDNVYEEIDKAFKQDISGNLSSLLTEMVQTAEILTTTPVKDGEGIYIKDFEAMSKEQQRKIILDKMNDLYCDRIPNGHCIESEFVCFLTRSQTKDNVFNFNFHTLSANISVNAILFENDVLKVKLDKPVYLDDFKKFLDDTGKSIMELKTDIINSATMYINNAEKVLKNAIAVKINHFNTEIDNIDKNLSLISDEPLFNNLLDILELDTDYRIYQKNDTIYFIDDDDTVVRELSIEELEEGNLPTDIITDYKAEQLFNYEDIGFTFDEFDYDLQELLDDGLRTEYYNILKKWNDEHNDIPNEILGYYKTLCDWYNTGKIKPMTREEIDILIPVAKDEYEAIIDGYESPIDYDR